MNLLEVVDRGNYVVLDTETTGLERPAEICQIAVIDASGAIIHDLLVKPKLPIPPDAERIHRISNAMVEDAPTWPLVRPHIIDAIAGRDVIVYNAVYDRKLMHWSDEAWGGERIEYKERATWWCAMEFYAELWGEYNGYHGSYRWQRLTTAMHQQGLKVENAHGALGDALMTLALIKHMAAGKAASLHYAAEAHDSDE